MIATTKRRTNEPSSVASSGEPQTPGQRLQGHPGYAAAREKLNKLDSERAAVQAKLDQAKALLHDADSIAAKILSGEPLAIEDDISTEVESAKLRGYQLAMTRQRAEIERELRIVSAEICSDEAPAHRQRAEELVSAGEKFFATVDAMESQVKALRDAGVIVSNDFPIFSGQRLRTLIQGLQPIVGEFKTFLQQ